MQTTNPFKILFLCTGNSARSILAEYIMKRSGQGKFESYSAGTVPKGKVHPMALRVLRELYDIDPSDAQSKSVDVFKNGPAFDFVVTVCDNARETCPVWPDRPIIAHWSSPDPAAFVGTEEQIFAEFNRVSLQIQRRIDLFCSLPFEKLERLRLEELTQNIGKS